MIISVKLFGAFRNHCPQSTLTLDLVPNSTVAEVKIKLEKELSSKSPHSEVSVLLSRSVLADENRILDDQDRISEGMKLAILPPVCGG